VLDGGLGRIEHHFLGERTGSCYVDGSLAYGSPERPVVELAEVIDEVEPDTVLTFGPDGMTGHPDHRAVSAWTWEALGRSALGQPRAGARLLHATLTGEFQREFAGVAEPMDDGPDVFPVCPRSRLAVDLQLGPADLDRKIAALSAHASQVGPLREALGEQRYRRFVAGEWFRPAVM